MEEDEDPNYIPGASEVAGIQAAIAYFSGRDYEPDQPWQSQPDEDVRSSSSSRALTKST